MLRLVDVSKNEQVRLFNLLAIEISARCNRTCYFCPARHDDRPDEYMSIELICRMTNELNALKWRGRVELYIYNDPLGDSRLVEILQRVREIAPRVCLMIATNGDRIKTREDVTRLYDAGLNQLLVNVYSAGDGHESQERRDRGVELATRRADFFDAMRDGLLAEGTILASDDVYHYISPRRRTMRVERKYGLTAASAKIGRHHLQNRSGNAPWFRGPTEEPLSRMCVKPFRVLNVNWRGDAILCCNDYHGEVVMGNARDHTLVELWNHPKFHEYRLMLQNKRRDMPLCRGCDYAEDIYGHMVDHVTLGESEDARLLARVG